MLNKSFLSVEMLYYTDVIEMLYNTDTDAARLLYKITDFTHTCA